MQQLSGADNLSLFAERRNNYSHVGLLSIYDVSTAPEGKVRFKDILKHFDDRMYLHPVFRQHLVEVPLGLDRPYWVTGGEIDVEYHIRHIALPAPGDWRQLMIQVARLHSRPLDRSRPLWEVYIIEGLDNIPKLPPGAFAMFMKIHHAAVDGLAALHLAKQLHSATPVDLHPARGDQSVIAEYDPSTVDVLSRALVNNMQRVGKAFKMTTAAMPRLVKAAQQGLQSWGEDEDEDGEALAPLPSKAPQTRFSAHVSRNRVVEGFGMPLSRIQRVRSKLPGITLNDIFIAVAGGGVHKYLKAKGELPDQSLIGLMPISLRTDASAGGNDVAGVPVRVCSNIANPLERVRAVHHEARASKTQAENMGLDLMKNLFDIIPSKVANVLLENFVFPRLNMAVSNVRGPDNAMYLAGAKAMCLYPVSIPADGSGLNITGVSYNKVMWVSVVSCRAMLPDPSFYVQCMREAWEELLAAADALPAPGQADLKSTSKGKKHAA